MSWKLAYHNGIDGEQQPESPSIDSLVEGILKGCRVRVLIVRPENVLVCDTVTVCLDPPRALKTVSALLPLQPAMREGSELNPVFGMSAVAIKTTGKYSQIQSGQRRRLSEDYCEIKWFIDD